MKSCYLLPERAIAGGEERVLPCIPTQKMGRVHVLGVGVSAGPYFVKQEGSGRVQGAVKVESKTAFFFSRWPDECTQLSFQQHFLSFSRAQNHDQRHSILGQLPAGPACFPCGAFSLSCSRLSRFALAHLWAGLYPKSPAAQVIPTP